MEIPCQSLLNFCFNLCFQLWDVPPCRIGEFTVIKPDILDLARNNITD